MLRLSLLIQLTERVTAPVRRIRSAIRGMVVTGERDVARLNKMMERLGKTAHSVGSFIGRTLRTGFLAGTAAAGGLIASIISTTSKFEQFQVVLENTEGSAIGARKAMDWVKNFAKTTPYEIEQVMEAFVALKAYGIDPTNGSLTSLGNAASGMNKPLMAAIEMLADAQTGEFERLKEFGVRAKAQGDKVTLTYMKAGKEVSVTAKKSAVEIQKALMGIFDARFKGMMDRQSRTLSGLWSNLKDQLANFQLDVGNAGFFDYVKRQIERLLQWVNKLAADGTLQKWAKLVSDRLIQLAEKLRTIDWERVWNALKGIGSALMAIGSFFGTVERVFGIFNMVIVAIVGKIAFSIYGLATALGLVSIAGAPIWLVIGAIAALAAIAILVWKNWGKVSAFFGRMWTGIKAAFKSGVAAVWNGLPAWFRGILTGAKFAINLAGRVFGGGDGAPAPGVGGGAPGARGPRAGGPPAARGPSFRNGPSMLLRRTSAEVGGQIDIRLQTDRGTRATVTRAKSDNRNVPINVGHMVTA